VTQDASPRLHVVTDNQVERLVDDGVLAGLLRRAEVLDARVAASRVPRPTGLLAVGLGLTVVLAALGRQAWQLPHRGPDGVTDVPQSLLSFLLLCAAGCVWAAGRTARPAGTLPSAGAVRLWWALLAGTALVSVAAALSLASYAGTGQRPADLVVRCAVPLVPALLAGALATGRTARIRAALATGLVTVPLGGLGWALLSSSGSSTAGLVDVLAMTALSAAAPLAVAVAAVAAQRSGGSSTS
jgi:hypothetical protein